MDYPPLLQNTLGHFDLDPCAADHMPYITADRMITKKQDGLSFDWGDARVWLNPPYGNAITPFLERMSNGIALLPVRTDTKWFHDLVMPKAKGILFMKGRVKFINKHGDVVGSPAFASMLVAYTQHDIDALKQSGVKGIMMHKEVQ